MALPNTYRMIVRNNTGGIITDDATFKVEITPYRFNESTGQIEYGTAVDMTPSEVPPDGQFRVSGTVVTGNGYIGLKGNVFAKGSGTGGNVEVFVEWPRSTTEYPTDSLAATDNPASFTPQLASMPVVAGGREANFSYE